MLTFGAFSKKTYCPAADDGNNESLQEESEDAMKRLENVTKDSKREMDILDALDEVHRRVWSLLICTIHSTLRQVRMLNARNNDITTDQMLQDLRERAVCIPPTVQQLQVY